MWRHVIACVQDVNVCVSVLVEYLASYNCSSSSICIFRGVCRWNTCILLVRVPTRALR